MSMTRRHILVGAGGIIAASAANAVSSESATHATGDGRKEPTTKTYSGVRAFNSLYHGDYLNQIAFPMGGIGAGMICLEGTGALSKFSLRNRPDLGSEPHAFSAICIKGSRKIARVLEGPVPVWKLRPFLPGVEGTYPGGCWGLPRFRQVTFESRFPFGTVRLKDAELPLEVELTGWSPFSPGDADNSSLPVAGLEYRFLNRSPASVEAVFSFHAQNFLAERHDFFKKAPSDRIRSTAHGFVLSGPGVEDRPWDDTSLAVWVDNANAKVNPAWMRGVDSLQIVWRDIESGESYSRAPIMDDSSPGASIFVPFSVAPGEARTISLRFAWHAPRSNLFKPADIPSDSNVVSCNVVGCTPIAGTYQPWYAGRFSSLEKLIDYWQSNYQPLRQAAEKFSRVFYDTTLPPEVMEAVASNLSILKSPTVLRQTDGRLWGWEGSRETQGSCYGSSTHVWNYAQAIAHLFPELERSLRETEFGANQNDEGHQFCRAAIPIRSLEEKNAPPDAADGQLGGIIKFYRDWRISGDTAWLQRWWPKIRACLDYCISTWDPGHKGVIEEPHINTYDIEFWGADSMCTSIYISALKAAILMGEALGDNIELYSSLLSKSSHQIEQLFNDEYFFQETKWQNLRAPYPRIDDDSPNYPEFLELARKDGPPYQYGQGCLSDGVLGEWLSLMCGVGEVLDSRKVESHLLAVYHYNFKKDFTKHVNIRRPYFACGHEAGLACCTWPRGGRPLLAMIYSDEVWTGIEYQVASHLVALGKTDEGLEIVRACRSRYDGRIRNPFDEIEAGHWYARAMSSYALLQAFSGARFDAVEKILYLRPAIKGDFRCFLSTATGFGTVGVKNGKPFVEVVSGRIPYREIKYESYSPRS
ncbi:MAG TPA: GH116 family glycosyl hydrolase [Terriglobales bacterium]|nr:GH116 family glycosyl hydrolase [Terriglobales bacterium]